MNELRGRERGRLLSVDEVAEILGVKDYTVRRWIDAGLLKACRMGSPRRPVWRIAESDLDDYIEATRLAPAQLPAPADTTVVRRRRR